MASEILLESGTNEVEILEFYLNGLSYGINVAKIAQITPLAPDRLTELPGNVPAIIGTFLWQGRTIPLIDLNQVMNRKKIDAQCLRPIVLVTEFNNVINGFLTEGVNRINRASWEDIIPLSPFLEKYSSMVTGSIHVEDREVMLVDFEYIIAELFPETKMGYQPSEIGPEEEKKPGREGRRIVFAEDSQFIRTTIVDLLRKAGYHQVFPFENGEDALRHIQKLIQQAASSGRELKDLCSLVISDIEMPKMDGLTLCRLLKDQLNLKDLPVIMFSSLINDQMIQKCKEVRADGFTTKPQVANLLEQMDRCLGLA